MTKEEIIEGVAKIQNQTLAQRAKISRKPHPLPNAIAELDRMIDDCETTMRMLKRIHIPS